MTISPHRTEYVQCFHAGGTKLEYFSQHFENLALLLFERYPQKTIVVLLDNLASHKSQQVVKMLTTYNRLEMLLTPSNSP